MPLRHEDVQPVQKCWWICHTFRVHVTRTPYAITQVDTNTSQHDTQTCSIHVHTHTHYLYTPTRLHAHPHTPDPHITHSAVHEQGIRKFFKTGTGIGTSSIVCVVCTDLRALKAFKANNAIAPAMMPPATYVEGIFGTELISCVIAATVNFCCDPSPSTLSNIFLDIEFSVGNFLSKLIFYLKDRCNNA